MLPYCQEFGKLLYKLKTSTFYSSDVSEETELLFRIFDTDRSGKIDPEEVRDLFNCDIFKRRKKL